MIRLMKTLIFSGSSDDTFGHQSDDYDNCASGEPITFQIKRGEDEDFEGLFVIGQYGIKKLPGVWSIGIAPIDEDCPLPDWEMEWSAQSYSTVLKIKVPGDCEIKCLNRAEGG